MENKVLTLQEAKDLGYHTWRYPNGDFSYTLDWTEYLVRDGILIASGDFVSSFDNGDYRCVDENGIWLYSNKERRRKWIEKY